MKGLLVIISGPSGAGKTTVVQAVVERMHSFCPIKRVITYTSRVLGPEEKTGVDYHSITPEAFEEKIQQGFFLEWSTAYGTYYGTPRTVLEDIAQGIVNVIILDREGGKQLKAQVPQALTVWLTVPSLEELRRRLELRGRDSQEQIERRLFLAKNELEQESQNPFYAYSIENSDKESTVIALERLILETSNTLI